MTRRTRALAPLLVALVLVFACAGRARADAFVPSPPACELEDAGDQGPLAPGSRAVLDLPGAPTVSVRDRAALARRVGLADSPPPQEGAITWGGAGDDFAGALAVDGSGNVYVAGFFVGAPDFDPGSSVDSHTSNGARDAYVAKFDSQGSLLWARTWGGTGDDTANGLAVDAWGHVYVSGRYRNTVDFDPGPGVDNHMSQNLHGENNCFLSKFGPTGSFTWARTWGGVGGASGDEAYGVAVDPLGNAYVVGDFSSPTVDFDPGTGVDLHTNHGFFDAFLLKLAANGDWVWAQSWGGPLYDDGPRVTLDGAGRVLVAGMCQNTFDMDPGSGVDMHTIGGGNFDYGVFVSMFDLGGNYQWGRTWGGTRWDIGQGLAVDAAGRVYVSGYFEGADDFDPGSGIDNRSSQGSFDAFLSQFDAQGNRVWTRTWGAGGQDTAECVAIDARGDLYITGWYNGSVDFDPGSGVASHTSQGANDGYLAQFDKHGDLVSVRTWGASGDDRGTGAAVDQAGNTYTVGVFTGSVDFAPASGGDVHTSQGGQDAFLLVARAPNYVLSLAPGWNLVSSPLAPAAGHPATFLQAIVGQYDHVFAYRASDPASPWRSYAPAAPAYANDLTHIDETLGLWIHAQLSTTLRIVGSPPLDQGIPLRSGWNLVGYPASVAHPITEALASIGPQVELVYAWRSGAWLVYDPAQSPQSGLTSMAPGQGYWIRVRQNCVWRP